MNEIAELIINTGFSKLANQNASLPSASPAMSLSPPYFGDLSPLKVTEFYGAPEGLGIAPEVLMDLVSSAGKSSLYGAGLGALYMGARGGGGAVNRLARATLGGILGGGAAGIGGAVGFNQLDPKDKIAFKDMI